MNKIPSNVPVFIKDIEQQDDGIKTYTKAKLKVFYVGETPDHRLFTKDFSDKVIQTLPLTPVVGFYSEEDEDFKGHNSIQYVYGVVPDSAEMSYEEDEDSGNTYFITDVILYTERKDNIGKVANKIIGKQHSLELDPDSLKYTINRDSQGRFLNIEFLDGKFVGLSVLGDNETPAFTGSGFFTINKDFELISNECKDKFDKFLNLLNNNGGNIEVFNSENFFNAVKEKFAKITMQDYQSKIYKALEQAGCYGWLVENTEDYAIVSTWDEEQSRSVYLKYALSLVDDAIVLGDCTEVVVKYLTQEELTALDSANASDDIVDEDKKDDENKGQCAEDVVVEEDDDNDDKDDNTEEPVVEEDDKKDDFAADDAEPEEEEKVKEEDFADDKKPEEEPSPAEEKDDKKNEDDFSANTQIEGAVNNASQSIVQDEKDEQMGTPAASASATALSDGEKAELEKYRREEKQRMICEYKGDLAEEVIKSFEESIDSFTKEELEAKLAIEYRKFKKSANDETNKTITAFSILTSAATKDYDQNSAADVINKYAKKK